MAAPLAPLLQAAYSGDLTGLERSIAAASPRPQAVTDAVRVCVLASMCLRGVGRPPITHHEEAYCAPRYHSTSITHPHYRPLSRPPQDGKNAFHYAVSEGQQAAAEFLLDRGFDIDARTKKGLTAFHFAAHRGHHALAEWLLSRGSDVHAVDSTGEWRGEGEGGGV